MTFKIHQIGFIQIDKLFQWNDQFNSLDSIAILQLNFIKSNMCLKLSFSGNEKMHFENIIIFVKYWL